MDQQYLAWKQSLPAFITTVQGIINPNGVECVTVGWSWAAFLFPGVPINASITTGDARTVFDAASPLCFDKLRNTGGAKPNVVPQRGDIAVYGETPTLGFTNEFVNPFGHEGIVDSFDSNGITLLQQDGSEQSIPVGLKYRPYSYAPLIGLLRSKGVFMNEGDVRNLYLSGWQRPPTDVELKTWIGRTMQDFFYEGGKNQYQWLWDQLTDTQAALTAAKNAQLAPAATTDPDGDKWRSMVANIKSS